MTGARQHPLDEPAAGPLPAAGGVARHAVYPHIGETHPAATECMDDLAQPLLDFIRAHQDWAIAVMFITAFGESFAFLSLLFPGTTLLIAAGALIKTGTCRTCRS